VFRTLVFSALLIAATAPPTYSQNDFYLGGTATTAPAPAGWTGIRVLLGDAQSAWEGRSTCGPCNQFCRDLRERNERFHRAGDQGWLIGFTEKGNDIHLMTAPNAPHTPIFQRVENGQVTGHIDGYQGDLLAVLRLHPGPRVYINAPLNEDFQISTTGDRCEPRTAQPISSSATYDCTNATEQLQNAAWSFGISVGGGYRPPPVRYRAVPVPVAVVPPPVTYTYVAPPVTTYRTVTRYVATAPAYDCTNVTRRYIRAEPYDCTNLQTYRADPYDCTNATRFNRTIPVPRYSGPIRTAGPTWSIDGTPARSASRGYLIQHLSRTHGYSVSYLQGLSQSQLIALHDNDHNSGRVTAQGHQRWTAPAPVRYAPQPVRYSAPQQYYASTPYRGGGGPCPNGMCPN
jgi:hypothetical protein